MGRPLPSRTSLVAFASLLGCAEFAVARPALLAHEEPLISDRCVTVEGRSGVVPINDFESWLSPKWRYAGDAQDAFHSGRHQATPRLQQRRRDHRVLPQPARRHPHGARNHGRSRDFRRALRPDVAFHAGSERCEHLPADRVRADRRAAVPGPDLALVPHYLPGKNPFVNELTQNRGIPVEATLGGPETMYPEFRKKLKDTYVMPPPCKTGCGGPPNPPQPAPPPAATAPRR